MDWSGRFVTRLGWLPVLLHSDETGPASCDKCLDEDTCAGVGTRIVGEQGMPHALSQRLPVNFTDGLRHGLSASPTSPLFSEIPLCPIACPFKLPPAFCCDKSAASRIFSTYSDSVML